MEADAASLANELRALAPGKQRQVLAVLSAAERATVQALLESAEEKPEAPAKPLPSALSRLSSGFREQVEAAIEPEGHHLTEAARTALEKAIAELSPANHEPVKAHPVPGPSLFGWMRRRLRSAGEAA